MKRFAIGIMAILSVGVLFLSCEKGSGADEVTGAVTVNINNDGRGKSLGTKSESLGGENFNFSMVLEITSSNNLLPYANATILMAGLVNSANILYLGKGQGLGSIKTSSVPVSGWSRESAAVAGGMYVIEYQYVYENIDTHEKQEGTRQYIGLFVQEQLVNAANEIIGYTVQYCPFTPGKGWNQ